MRRFSAHRSAVVLKRIHKKSPPHSAEFTRWTVERRKSAAPSALPEDIFDFVEDRRVPICRLVFHLNRRVKLLQQPPLFACQLRRRHHSYVVVEVAPAAAAWVRQTLALDAKHRAALCAFRNLELFLTVQSGNLQLRSQCRLRDA